MAIRLFRFHKGTLEDSLKTVEKVSSKKDIKKIFDAKMNMFDMNNDPYWTDISIDTDFVDDSDRCGDEWKETHYVKAYSPMDDVWHVIGMCNFYE